MLPNPDSRKPWFFLVLRGLEYQHIIEETHNDSLKQNQRETSAANRRHFINITL